MFKKFKEALQHNSPKPPSEILETAAEEAAAAVDLTLPRISYDKNELTDNGRCPQCNTSLSKEYGSYMVALFDQQGKVADAFTISGHDIGYYCPTCPTVVLDYDPLTKQLNAAQGYFKDVPTDTTMSVLGLLDIDAMAAMDPESLEQYPIISFKPSPPARPQSFSAPKTKKQRPRKPKRKR